MGMVEYLADTDVVIKWPPLEEGRCDHAGDSVMGIVEATKFKYKELWCL